MYNINDKIIYKRDVCIIKEIKEKLYNNTDYYKVSPLNDLTLTINIPANSPAIKSPLTKEEALAIIESIPSIEPIKSNDKSLENVYKELLSTEELKDLICIIKTTYLRNKQRIDNGKKIGDKDENYFQKAEYYLYSHLATSLNMTYDECQEYIKNYIESKEVKWCTL